jgi:hypothetical protein
MLIKYFTLSMYVIKKYIETCNLTLFSDLDLMNLQNIVLNVIIVDRCT